MRAVSAGRAAVQDIDTDHGRLYVAMAEKFLDRADIVALSSGCVADKWPLQIIFHRGPEPSATPEAKGIADDTGPNLDIGSSKSGLGGTLTVRRT